MFKNYQLLNQEILNQSIKMLPLTDKLFNEHK